MSPHPSMNPFEPDLVVPRRLGPSRAERVADWIAGQEEYHVFGRDDFVGIKVGIASCRNLILRLDACGGARPSDHAAAMIALACLRRIQEFRTPKNIYMRLAERLSCVATYAVAQRRGPEGWWINAYSASPWSPAAVIGLGDGGHAGMEAMTRIDITPHPWSTTSPSIVCVHAAHDLVFAPMSDHNGMASKDDPVAFLRAASRGAAILDDPASDPWILPDDETPR